MLQRPRARFVESRKLADGTTAFYFCIPRYYRKLGCEIANEPLGTSYEAACGEDGKGGRAATLNALFDEWNEQRKGGPIEQAKIARYGTIDWLFRQYKTEKAYTEKAAPRSQAARGAARSPYPGRPRPPKIVLDRATRHRTRRRAIAPHAGACLPSVIGRIG